MEWASHGCAARAAGVLAMNAMACENIEVDITVWSSAPRHSKLNMLIHSIPISKQTVYMWESL